MKRVAPGKRARRYRMGMRRVALRQPELLIFFFGVKRLMFGAEMKMFASEQLHSGVEMLMLMGGMLYFIRQTLYSAGEMLHSIGWQLLLGNEMLYRCTVRRPSWCESFLS